LLILGDILNTSTQLGPKRFKAQWEASIRYILEEAERWESAVEGFKHLRNAFVPMDEDEAPEKFDQERFFGSGATIWYGWIDKDALVMKGAPEFVNQGIILIRPHLDLLIEALARIILFYIAKAYSSKPEVGRKLVNDLMSTIEAAGKASTSNVPKVHAAAPAAMCCDRRQSPQNKRQAAVRRYKFEFAPCYYQHRSSVAAATF